MRVFGLVPVTAFVSLLASGCGGDDNPMASATNTTPGTSITTNPGTLGTSTSGPDTGTTQAPTEGGTSIGSDSASSSPTTGTTGPDPTDTNGTTEPGACVEADCAMGEYCDGVACVPGCNDDTDCLAPSTCDLGSHSCKGCLSDANCGLGTVCEGGECVPGCNDMQPCDGGLACCTGSCVDALVDPLHCGGCDPCPAPNHAEATCVMGVCGVGACDAGWNDCDKNPNNGCETQGSCQCTPGEMQPCYTGPQGTDGVGICKAGTHTCNAQGTGFGACEGEVTPNAVDLCSNGLDDNCDGQVDEDPDADGDGWTVCGGDCCDAIGPNCLNPDLVNPGAFEVMGNMVDDDCDGNKDNVLAACDQGLTSNSADALDYARAIDLCQFTTENPPLNMKKWGVISGQFSRSNGLNSPAANARSIRPGFGSAITPQKNTSLAVLSTGNAADANDAAPPYAAFQGGTDHNTEAAVPADWLAANGNNFPNAPGCPEPQGGATGNDTIQLKLRIRVPTNALSFSAHVYFFSSEYPEWVCSPFNDFFLTLVDGMGMGNPNDKNVAIYKNQNNQTFPLGVNILKAAPGLFTQCKNGQISCAAPPTSNYNGCTSNAELVGTGFDPTNPGPQFPADPGYCGANNQVGGGTGWLKMAGNVSPGETMELRFVLWDTGDGFYDSVVLLDNFEWSLQASQPGVQPG